MTTPTMTDKVEFERVRKNCRQDKLEHSCPAGVACEQCDTHDAHWPCIKCGHYYWCHSNPLHL